MPDKELGFFRSLFSRKTSGASQRLSQKELKRDARRHKRYGIMRIGAAVCYVRGAEYSVANLGYGGVALVGMDENIFNSMGHGEPAVLSVLSRKLDVMLSKVYGRHGVVGFSYVEPELQDIIFLKSACQYVGQGASLSEISQEHLKDKYRDGNWRCFRGEGPCDLMVQVDRQSPLATEVLLTFHLSGYCELAYSDGRLQTRRALDDVGVAARMAPTERLDPDILRSGLLILLGTGHHDISAVIEPACRRMLEAIS